MEYICRIERNVVPSMWLNSSRCLKFPELTLKEPWETVIKGESYILFMKEDKYTPNLIVVNPPKIFTDEELEIITRNWDKCVEEDLSELEFEL